ncbi:MAG: type II 3-dehydroquinate dehydratase [Clostridiales bacterium]|nr:type II 3-dehydroquinate dehydratase [Clostridiales bacterium]
MKILIINGPNLNMLGKREENIYGKNTYEDLCKQLNGFSFENNIEIEIFQSAIEGEIVNKIHQFHNYDGLIINPAAFSHYSIAIYDALLIAKIPKIEVHISNVHTRDDFRKNLITAQAVDGIISGLGFKGYELALEYIIATNV